MKCLVLMILFCISCSPSSEAVNFDAFPDTIQSEKDQSEIDFFVSKDQRAPGHDVPFNDVKTDAILDMETQWSIKDPEANEKFNNDYGPYISKAELKPQALNGKNVYIVNQGGDDTSIPSCLNGKVVLQDCPPTGWKFGVKKNEIYALRLKTKARYSTAGIRSRMNTFSGGDYPS